MLRGRPPYASLSGFLKICHSASDSEAGFQPKQHPAMHSLPQELLEEIIDHLPKRDAAASSLVSRCWGRRGQQRYFESILFLSAHQVALWGANIPQDPDGICFCVRHVRFDGSFTTSLEPTTFGRILKSFKSMLTLTMRNNEIPPPEELTDPISHGKFGKGVTRFVLSGALYTPHINCH